MNNNININKPYKIVLTIYFHHFFHSLVIHPILIPIATFLSINIKSKIKDIFLKNKSAITLIYAQAENVITKCYYYQYYQIRYSCTLSLSQSPFICKNHTFRSYPPICSQPGNVLLTFGNGPVLLANS